MRFNAMRGSSNLGSGIVAGSVPRSEEHTSELQSRLHLVCRLLLEKKKNSVRKAHYTRRPSTHLSLIHTCPFSRTSKLVMSGQGVYAALLRIRCIIVCFPTAATTS